MSSGAHNGPKTGFDLYIEDMKTKSLKPREILLCIGFLSLGLTACTDIKTEVVANKQSTSDTLSKKYGSIDGATKADRSLWNLSYKQNK